MEMVFRQRTGYLEICIEGTAPLDIDATLRRIFAACVEHRAGRVLVDFRLVVGDTTTMRRLMFGLAMADLNYAHLAAGDHPVRFAFLGEEPLVEPARLGETVAVNRGVDVRVSTDPEEAMQYLLPDLGSAPHPAGK